MEVLFQSKDTRGMTGDFRFPSFYFYLSLSFKKARCFFMKKKTNICQHFTTTPMLLALYWNVNLWILHLVFCFETTREEPLECSWHSECGGRTALGGDIADDVHVTHGELPVALLLAETQSPALLPAAGVRLHAQEHRALQARNTTSEATINPTPQSKISQHTQASTDFTPVLTSYHRTYTSGLVVGYLDVDEVSLCRTEHFAASVDALVYGPVASHLDLWQG